MDIYKAMDAGLINPIAVFPLSENPLLDGMALKAVLKIKD